MESKCPWVVVKRQFPDLNRVELVVSVNEYDDGMLSRWLEIYGNGDRWHTSLKPKWIDEVLPDDEARDEMNRQGVVDIMRVAASVAYPQKVLTFCGCNRKKFFCILCGKRNKSACISQEIWREQ